MTKQALSFGLVTAPTSPIPALEALPYDSLWVGGHIASRTPSPEAIVGLTRLATLTTRVRIGTSVLVLPLYPTAIVAKQISDLVELTGGRVTLGIGVGGEYPIEFELCGVPMEGRGARTDGAIARLRDLWSAGAGAPIVVAGRTAPAMRRAALLGDGWMPYLYSPERYERSVVEIRAKADAAGRDLSGFEWFAWVFVNVQDTTAAARTDATAFFGDRWGQDLDAMLDRVAAVGTPDEVAERLRAFVDAGAGHLIVCPASRGDIHAMAERVAHDVLPLVTR